MQQPIPLYAFTIKLSQRVGVLATEIGVSEPAADNAQPRKFNAIWDTGAINSVISRKVVDALDLKAVSTTRNQTANGEREAGVYIVDLYLPNKVVLSPDLHQECKEQSDEITKYFVDKFTEIAVKAIPVINYIEG